MYITIDGDSGAGKSTQFHILSERLGLSSPGFLRAYSGFSTIFSLKQEFSPYSDLLATISASHTIPTGQNWIFDHFWHCFYRFRDVDPNTLDNILTFFRNGLTLNNRHEPTLSIFLDIPRDVSVHRCLQRDTGHNIQYKPTSYDDKEDKLMVWRTIETNCPYFRIIDGNRPVPEVTESIIDLLPKQF